MRAANPSGWSAFQFETSQGYWQLEVHPNSHEEANRRFNMLFNPNTGKRVYLSFPSVLGNGDTVAYRSWAVNKSGDTMTGDLSFKQGNYSGSNLYNNDGYYARIEGNPHNVNSLLTLVYRTPQGANIAIVSFPKKMELLHILTMLFLMFAWVLRLSMMDLKDFNSYGQGMVITGANFSEIQYISRGAVYFRPIQKLVNGRWITISNA